MKHKKNMIKCAKARVTGTAPYRHEKVQRGITATKFRRSKVPGNTTTHGVLTTYQVS
jgi:hypothetical protein